MGPGILGGQLGRWFKMSVQMGIPQLVETGYPRQARRRVDDMIAADVFRCQASQSLPVLVLLAAPWQSDG